MDSRSSSLMDSCVAPAAADAAARLLESATEDRKRIRKYLARLKEVCSCLCCDSGTNPLNRCAEALLRTPEPKPAKAPVTLAPLQADMTPA